MRRGRPGFRFAHPGYLLDPPGRVNVQRGEISICSINRKRPERLTDVARISKFSFDCRGLFVCVGRSSERLFIDRGFGFYLSRHLEEFKSILRKGEDELRHKLQQQDVQLQAIREAALRHFGERTAALDQRRLEAYDRLWMAVIGQNQFKLASRLAQPLNIDEILKDATHSDSEGQKVRNFGEQLWKMCGLDKLRQVDPPDKERPFISAIAWARFSAYRAGP